MPSLSNQGLSAIGDKIPTEEWNNFAITSV